jgi:Holliday junction resolvase RusA-like endonuclease
MSASRTILDAVVMGDPRGYQRPGVRVVAPKGKQPFATLYEQEETRNWRAIASDVFVRAAAGVRVEDESVLVHVFAVGKRPRSLPKKLGCGRLWRTTKPDADNVAKSVCDALVQAGVLRDDTLVGRLVVDSLIAADGEAPHVRVRIETLAPRPVVPWPTTAAKAASGD